MITTDRLGKTYGTVSALADVSLDIPEGVICGLVGPNGAGKSTLLGVLAGLRRPTSGTVRISAPRDRRSLMPDTPQFDPWLTAREVVGLSLQLIQGRRNDDRVVEVLTFAGLGSAADRRVGGFSRGMLQRLGLAASVVSEPALLMMDEPASALDPQGRVEVLQLISAMRGTATVLFSSHILADVQAICDHVVVLDEGRVRYQGPMDNLLGDDSAQWYRIRVADRVSELAEEFRREDWVVDAHVEGTDTIRLRVRSRERAQVGIVAVLAGAGGRLISAAPQEPTLEEVFLELTR